MRLQSFAKVRHAQDSVDDRDGEHQYGNDRKESETSSCWRVVGDTTWVTNIVHSDELEKEVRHGREVEDYDDDLAGEILLARPVSGEEQNDDRYWYCDPCEDLLDQRGIGDDYQELDRETQKEEKVELEQSDVDLRPLVSFVRSARISSRRLT